jgi:hypothetical protein
MTAGSCQASRTRIILHASADKRASGSSTTEGEQQGMGANRSAESLERQERSRGDSFCSTGKLTRSARGSFLARFFNVVHAGGILSTIFLMKNLREFQIPVYTPRPVVTIRAAPHEKSRGHRQTVQA